MKTSTVLISSLLGLMFSCIAHAQADPGKEVIGKLKGSIVYATNSNESSQNATPVSGALQRTIVANKLPFATYYLLGTDRQDVYKGYPNWLKPMRGSDAMMLSYEPKQTTAEGIKVEVSFWQNKQKIFSTKTLTIKPGTPLIFTGPQWRNGKVLIVLELEQ